MSESAGERNIEPTPRRRQEARNEGRVARSSALSSSIIIVGGLAVLTTCGPRATLMMGKQLRQHLGDQAPLSMSQGQAVSDWQQVTFDVLSAIAPLLAGFFLVAIVANLAQTGFLFIPKNVLPNFGRLSPMSGLRRTFSAANFVSVLLGLTQIVVAFTITWWCLKSDLDQIVRLVELQPRDLFQSGGGILLSAAMKVGLGLFAIALLDYAYRRWNHERELRMTPEQLREELRMIEGNPQTSSRRRQTRSMPTQE